MLIIFLILVIYEIRGISVNLVFGVYVFSTVLVVGGGMWYLQSSSTVSVRLVGNEGCGDHPHN